MGSSTARRMWGIVEPIHAVTYFSDEARAAGGALGVRGFWAEYVVQRAAPLGAVGRTSSRRASSGSTGTGSAGSCPRCGT
ncbi:hypothetical protein GCM10009836_50150 [Pseudonocardia ailaonensis]|uniref:Uncharacterized protein n=1 Tax=Pseudonocardia ailaonensis TaxID=367279 RepID=A0ABN2ND09_9PSEU